MKQLLFKTACWDDICGGCQGMESTVQRMNALWSSNMIVTVKVPVAKILQLRVFDLRKASFQGKVN